MAMLLKGAPVAAALSGSLAQRAQALRDRGVVPTLAILRVGEKPDDIAYESSAMKRCAKIGVEVQRFLLPVSCSREELLSTVEAINRDAAIHGCLMFRPLADRAANDAACMRLVPEKDVDCMTPRSLAHVFTSKGVGYPPCTAAACIEMLDHYGIALEGKRVTVVGRSLVVGRPVAMLLQARNATVTMCHTRTEDLAGECRRAEILVTTAGKAGLIGAGCVSPGQVVIDVGINVGPDGKLCGDVDFPQAEPIVSAITPVPGGVGAVTTAVLCKHLIQAAENLNPPRG